MGGGTEGRGYNSSWVNPNGNANFPYVNTDGNSNFNWTDNDFNDNWRWLVEVSNLRSFSPAFRRRSFFLESLNPAPEHAADLVQLFRDRDILFGIQCFYFPCDLKKELQRIQFHARLAQIRQFLLFMQDARDEKCLYDFKKQRINLPPECVSRLFRKVVFVFVPLLVCGNEFLNNRQCRPCVCVCVDKSAWWLL